MGGGGRPRAGRRTSDDDSDYCPQPDGDETEGRNPKQQVLWNALVEKHQAQIERWCTEISRRAALKRMDEEAGRPQVWGTAAAEEAEVTKGLGSFKWKMWLSLDATHDRRTRCWEKWLALMADHCLPEQMRLLCHGYNTCLLESFHSSC